MTNYAVRIEVKPGEVENILNELNEAQEKIYKCYLRLSDIGVLTISETEGESAPES